MRFEIISNIPLNILNHLPIHLLALPVEVPSTRDEGWLFAHQLIRHHVIPEKGWNI